MPQIFQIFRKADNNVQPVEPWHHTPRKEEEEKNFTNNLFQGSESRSCS